VSPVGSGPVPLLPTFIPSKAPSIPSLVTKVSPTPALSSVEGNIGDMLLVNLSQMKISEQPSGDLFDPRIKDKISPIPSMNKLSPYLKDAPSKRKLPARNINVKSSTQVLDSLETEKHEERQKVIVVNQQI
jgi:hypothetical protein